jgi:hypothetical protein
VKVAASAYTRGSSVLDCVQSSEFLLMVHYWLPLLGAVTVSPAPGPVASSTQLFCSEHLDRNTKPTAKCQLRKQLPGPEQRSLASMFMTEFVASRYILNSVNRYRQDRRYFLTFSLTDSRTGPWPPLLVS